MRLGTVKYFIQCYFTAIPKVIYSSTLGLLFSPRRALEFLEAVLEEENIHCPDPVIGSKGIFEMLGEDKGMGIDITLKGTYYDFRLCDTRQLLELSSIAYLLKAQGLNRIFEIGTYVGRMARLLALNANAEAIVYTLDLGQVDGYTVGECYKGSLEEAKIHQLIGDSRTFDFHAWSDSIDFCWIDGCHDYDAVLSDTRAAFKMVRIGGWVGWHDYRHTAWWSGVTRGVRQIHRRLGPRGEMTHLKGTTTALCRVTSQAKRLLET